MLGKHHIDTDRGDIAATSLDARVLITGVVVSVGPELARLVVGFGPNKLVLLD